MLDSISRLALFQLRFLSQLFLEAKEASLVTDLPTISCPLRSVSLSSKTEEALPT